MKILIVDDNPKVREMMRLFLGNLADEFRECEDGREALDAYRSFQPDWVLMDWDMAHMDGMSATRSIVGAFPRAKVLLFTQYDDDVLRNAARDAGAIEYVLKHDLVRLHQIVAGV